MVTIRASLLFFDSPKLTRALSVERRKALSRGGAFVRTRMRSIIRKRKRASAPGAPPHSHTGLLRRRIFFGYDPATKNVVVGPEKTNQVFFDGDGRPVTGTVPQILERGGKVRILQVRRPGGKWRRADLRSKRRNAGLEKRLHVVNIDARPFAGPALELERENLPKAWAGVIA